MRRSFAAAAVAVALAALMGAPVSASASPVTRAADGDCLTVDDITSVTSEAEAVSCAESHNAEVFYVGTAPNGTGLPSQALVTFQQMNSMCAASAATTALAEYLDHLGIPGATIPNRAYLSVLLPTDAEWESGVRSVACIVAVTSDDTEGVPVAQSWTGTAAQKTANEGAGWLLACLASAPSTGTTLPTRACTPSSWVLVDAGTAVTGAAGTPYPGATLQAAADDVCRPIAESWTAKDKRADLQFAAVLPPEEAWTAGVHVTSCWIPFSAWDGTVTHASPIPADAVVTVSGSTSAFAGASATYALRAATADDTGLALATMVVSLNGSAEFAGGGIDRVLTADGLGEAAVTVVAGESGRFTLTAALVDMPAATGSLEVTISAVPKPAVSITITGKRGKVGKTQGVIINGTTTGLKSGASVTPYFKVRGAKTFTKAAAVKVTSAGAFRWTKATGKAITVYVRAGKKQSNEVVVKP
ncbi:MAG: septum formation family protein [bacterium]